MNPNYKKIHAYSIPTRQRIGIGSIDQGQVYMPPDTDSLRYTHSISTHTFPNRAAF